MALHGPQVIKLLSRELRELQTRPEEGIRVIINEENTADVQAEYDGPAGTPYEGGVFRMKLILGEDFPHSPPKGYFVTKIFHPNVAKAGEICVNVLKKDWKPDLGLRHVFLVIRCLLVEPFPESALNEEAGRLLLEDYDGYARHARLWTSIHAQPSKRTTPLTAQGGSNAVNSSHEDSSAAPHAEEDPALKKSKSAGDKKAVIAKKRSLKRL